MRCRRRPTNAQWILIGALFFSLAPRAEAVEYRIQVINVSLNAFLSYLKPGELAEGATGGGLDALVARVDDGHVPPAVLFYDRPLRPASATTAKAYAATAVRVDVKPGGDRDRLWNEASWEGKPGEWSVWVVAPSARQPQQLQRLALRGVGPVRQFQPSGAAIFGQRHSAVVVSLPYLQAVEDRDGAARILVERYVNLDDGIAVIVAANADKLFPNLVYILVNQAPAPTTYKAVLAWQQRAIDIEAPGPVGRIGLLRGPRANRTR